MTNVSFFHGAPNRVQAATSWVVQHWRPGQRITIYTTDESIAHQLQQQLWQVPATGFIPHCATNSPLAAETAVLIGSIADPAIQSQCLLNLSNDTPPNFASFETLVEIVSTNEIDKLPARDRFKFYRERGYAITHQDITHGF